MLGKKTFEMAAVRQRVAKIIVHCRQAIENGHRSDIVIFSGYDIHVH